MTPYIAEFFGTLLLVLIGNGVVANVLLPQTKGHGAGWIAITTGWGLAVFVAVWCVGPISGAHINPAVTLGLAAGGAFAWGDVPAFITAQMLGGVVGGALAYAFYYDHYRLCDNGDTILGTFCNAPAVRRAPTNLLCEVIGTFVLVIAVMMATDPVLEPADGGEPAKIGLGAIGALPVGLLVLAIGMCLGGTTGYAINPARDLGPRIAHALLPIAGKRDSDWGYAWIPVVGPLGGGLLAAAFGRLLL